MTGKLLFYNWMDLAQRENFKITVHCSIRCHARLIANILDILFIFHGNSILLAAIYIHTVWCGSDWYIFIHFVNSRHFDGGKYLSDHLYAILLVHMYPFLSNGILVGRGIYHIALYMYYISRIIPFRCVQYSHFHIEIDICLVKM